MKRRCKLRTKMWEHVTPAQRAFNGQAPDGQGGFIRKQDRKKDKGVALLPPLQAADVVRMVARLLVSQGNVICTACHEASPDEGQRCCPKCKCPGWRGERMIENYPTQEGVKGCACQERSFLEKVVREG